MSRARHPSRPFLIGAALAASLVAPAAAQDPGTILGNAKITEDVSNFTGDIQKEDRYGASIAMVGGFLAGGTPGTDVAGESEGGIWMASLTATGSVTGQHLITQGSGGFAGGLGGGDEFGYALADLGDLDGDLVADLAVGAPGDDDGGADRGAVYVLFLNANGTVKSSTKLSDTAGGFAGALDNGDAFGSSVANLGDVDGDGNVDLAVGARLDDDGGSGRGAVWVVYLNANGTAKGHTKISATAGGFGGALANGDEFGSAVAALGDVDGDGVGDLAVGARADDGGGATAGAVWVLFLDAAEAVTGQLRIGAGAGGFTGTLGAGDQFGISLAAMGDVDNNGVPDLVAGAPGDDDGGANRGAAWLLLLEADGSVRAHRKYSETAGGFAPGLANNDELGRGVACLDDMNGDGVMDLALGAHLDDECNDNYGAIYAMRLDVAPFFDLGGASAGANGLPNLSAVGGLTPGSSLQLDVTNAPPNEFMLGWLALFPTSFPAWGGTIHALPFTSQFVFIADAAGSWTATTTWPLDAPSGIPFVLQFAIQDLTVRDHLTLTNGLRAVSR